MDTPPNDPDQLVPAGFRVVEISREPVELYKILKFEGLADSGGQARAAVASGRVSVNEVIEIQKRKKIRSGDKIEFEGEKLFIKHSALSGSETERTPEKTRVKRPSKPDKVARKSGAALVTRVKNP